LSSRLFFLFGSHLLRTFTPFLALPWHVFRAKKSSTLHEGRKRERERERERGGEGREGEEKRGDVTEEPMRYSE
jgi:hypothetical protein